MPLENLFESQRLLPHIEATTRATSCHRRSPSPVGRLTALGESFLMLT